MMIETTLTESNVQPNWTVPFGEITRTDIPKVGGKNASLGEMVRNLATRGIKVPAGFATTAACYWRFIEANSLQEVVTANLGAMKAGTIGLAEAGSRIRRAILSGEWPRPIAEAILLSYRNLGRQSDDPEIAVAVRSSATAEDLGASFAGQLETFLNIRGERALLDACRRCFASLFTDRAIKGQGP